MIDINAANGMFGSYSYFDLFGAGTFNAAANSGEGFANITTGGTGNYSGLTFTYQPAVAGNPGGWVSQELGQKVGYVGPNADQYLIFQPSTGTLVIVPEPSTWAMTLASVGFAGWMARRKKLARKRRMA